MKYRFQFLQLAQIDLQDVIDYLAQYSIDAAQEFLDELDKRLLQVCHFPKSCEVYCHNPTLRRLVIDKYLVFYEANEKSQVISVYRILHSSRNIGKSSLLGDMDN